MEQDRVDGSPRGRALLAPEGRVRPIVRVPDPLLRRVARPCSPRDPDVLEVAADLAQTLGAHPTCRGLSAPQIGRLLRIVAVNVTGDARAEVSHGPLVLVNPELVVTTGTRVGREGCLSIPSVVANVRRASRILVVAWSVEAVPITLETSGFEARVVQHELDHLDGVLILDRIRSLSDLSPRHCQPGPTSTAPTFPGPPHRTSG